MPPREDAQGQAGEDLVNEDGEQGWKKPCLSARVDAGRLFFARDLPRLSQQLLRRNRAGARVIACFFAWTLSYVGVLTEY